MSNNAQRADIMNADGTNVGGGAPKQEEDIIRGWCRSQPHYLANITRHFRGPPKNDFRLLSLHAAAAVRHSDSADLSLPAYMKEPGDQELVVSRGPDGEDVAMPEASADDDDDDDDRTADDTHGNNINLNLPPPRRQHHCENAGREYSI
ncbi:hypothetical protein C8J57DRAFT_1211927 [Mycena rebaudengoi]|nr:hypothetical protein C8J57DRAFT_1211927 [Mycena rebaudengoi]